MADAPVVQSLDDILASIQPGYQGQEDLYNKQIATLPGQEAGAIAGLDTAKSNSFRDINNSANASGLAFSGIPIEEQTRYLGEKYLPAIANLKNDTQNRQFTLQQALASLGTDKRNAALATQTSQKKSLEDYNAAELAYQRQVEAANRAYEQDMAKQRSDQAFQANQNALNRAAASASANTRAANAAAADYKVSKFKNGNWSFVGAGGAPVSMAQYLDGVGGNVGTLKNLLANGSQYDKAAYNQVKNLNSQAAIISALQKYDKGNFYGFK